MDYKWPVFRCPSLAGFVCPPRPLHHRPHCCKIWFIGLGQFCRWVYRSAGLELLLALRQARLAGDFALVAIKGFGTHKLRYEIGVDADRPTGLGETVPTTRIWTIEIGGPSLP